MEKICTKCGSLKKLHSFPSYRVGIEKKNRYFAVCYKCRYGYGNKKNIFENFKEESIRTKEILEKHVIKTSQGCWKWKGSKNIHGYGEVRINRKHMNGSRASWISYKGEIPKGMYVLHHCDNRECCNPEHLFLGTASDNMHDMMKKGRSNFLKGDDCPWKKITSEIVLDVLDSLKKGISTKEISKKHNISIDYISDIKRGHRWGHIGNRDGLIVKPGKIILDEEKVKNIKERLNNGERVRYIAKEYCVSETTISDIKHDRTWKYIKI
jgi:hypothetical protein